MHHYTVTDTNYHHNMCQCYTHIITTNILIYVGWCSTLLLLHILYLSFSSSTLISIISFLFYFISFPPFLSPSTKTKTTLNKNNTLIIYTVGRSIGRCPTSYRRCGLTAVEPKDQSVGTCVSRDRGMGLLAMAVPFASRPQGRWGFGEYFKFFKLYISH